MPLAEFLGDSKPATTAVPHPAAQLRKQVFLQFAAIIALGLALTGWYVGFRIFSERPALRPAVPVKRAQIAAPPAAKPVVTIAVPPAPSPVEHKPVETAVRMQPFTRRDASPRSGERYLQIAAFGPRALDGYLKKLESRGLHPVVAPGPVDSIYRILMGPFPNPTALEEARRSIKASGIEPILRAY
jgi:cell division septation protein DedD